jgi:hypothetical protein
MWRARLPVLSRGPILTTSLVCLHRARYEKERSRSIPSAVPDSGQSGRGSKAGANGIWAIPRPAEPAHTVLVLYESALWG